MNRRELLKAGLATPLLGSVMLGKSVEKSRKLIKPRRLRPGDTVAVVAPASGATADAFDRALASLAALGFKTRVGQYARGLKGFLSGTDKERLSDLHAAFEDKSVSAVWCLRGGSGSPRILPDVDYKLIARNPKVFIGYSDITAMHLAIHSRTGLVTFHGPGATSEMSDYTKSQLLGVISNPSDRFVIKLSDFNKAQASPLFHASVITPGKARGPLVGGNLSLLGALAGTPFGLKELKGRLLFMEDVNEPPYKVDRLLTQLRQSADLRSVAGIALGTFTNRTDAADEPAAPLLDVFKDRLGDLGVPVLYGLSFGHIRDQCTFPLGVEAELDTFAQTVTLLEPAVR
jgi:muramoyltetrapeptide carboxypeptidase